MVSVTTKGQVTIPKPIRDELGIEPGDEVDFVETEAGYIIQKQEPTTDDGDNPFAKYRGAVDEGTMTRQMDRLRGTNPWNTQPDTGDDT